MIWQYLSRALHYKKRKTGMKMKTFTKIYILNLRNVKRENP